MYKLIATHRTPPDRKGFEAHYHNVHMPLVQKIPGLARVGVNRGIAAPWGGESAFNLMAELHFADELSFNTAMASAESRAAGRGIRRFAGDLVTLATARGV